MSECPKCHHWICVCPPTYQTIGEGGVQTEDALRALVAFVVDNALKDVLMYGPGILEDYKFIDKEIAKLMAPNILTGRHTPQESETNRKAAINE